MKSELHQLLLNVKKSLPPDRRDAFASRIRTRLGELESLADIDLAQVTRSTVVGMTVGALLDLIPGAETLFGVEGFVDIGAALGAFVGLAKSASEKRARESIRAIVIEEINRLGVAA